MFDWVLNTPLFPDGYQLRGLYVHIVVPVCFNMQFQDHNLVHDCSFKEFLSFKFKICSIIVTASYNNRVLYKLNTFVKKQYFMVQVEVNWRKKLKPSTDAVLHIFFQKTPLISYAWILFNHIYSIFCDLDLFQTRVDLC